MPKCSACGNEIGGSNSEACPVTKSSHKFNSAADFREREERERRDREEVRMNSESAPLKRRSS
jgi:hypothetical protein